MSRQPGVALRRQPRLRGELHPALRLRLLEAGGHALGDRGEVHPAPLHLAAGHARQQEQVVNQSPHALRVRAYSVKVPAPSLVELFAVVLQ
jgi:hypothetical protein